MISKDREVPRVLLVTPEVAYLRRDMEESAGYPDTECGGLADFASDLATSLFRLGVDVHLAVPDYRTLYNRRSPGSSRRGLPTTVTGIPDERIHLAEDRAFFYLTSVYAPWPKENIKTAIVFQREVINNIIPRVQPDIIHCHDWMTGLIPAMARRVNIMCLFTIHHFDTARCTLEEIEDRGIDAAQFWNYLFFEHFPNGYEATRSFNRVDFLASGILAAKVVTIRSSSLLREVVQRRHHFVPNHIQRELRNKARAVEFFEQPAEVRHRIVERVMTESIRRYNCAEMASRHFRLYAEMLEDPPPNSRSQDTPPHSVWGSAADIPNARRNFARSAALVR
jgi:starch synthase